MRSLTILLCLLGIFLCCHQVSTSKKTNIQYFEQAGDLKILKDTFHFPTPGVFYRIALFRNEFYCAFRTYRRNKRDYVNKMVILDRQGKWLEDVILPEKVQDGYHFNLHIENDSLFLQHYEKEEIYVLGKDVASFYPVKTRKFKFFEDDDFDVFVENRGEWGSTIFFKDKHTQEAYEVRASPPVKVIKFEHEYYFTATSLMGYRRMGILKVSAPRTLQKSDFNLEMEYGSQYFEGIETVFYKDSVFLQASFLANNQFYHLYTDYDSTYIGKIEGDQMKQIHKFDFAFRVDFVNFHNGINGKDVLLFEIPQTEQMGILIINQDTLHFHFLNQHPYKNETPNSFYYWNRDSLM